MIIIPYFRHTNKKVCHNAVLSQFPGGGELKLLSSFDTPFSPYYINKNYSVTAGAQKSNKLNQLFSTHPDLDARIQRMEERATSEGIEKPAVTE